MKTREIKLSESVKAFHFHTGEIHIYLNGSSRPVELRKNEVEKLAAYFKDLEQGFENLYEPGRSQ